MADLRSYLAVPVVSRHGEVLGGLFFASSKPGVFTAQDEEIASGIAAQSGVAIDNARLFENAVRAQRELQTSNEELVTANRELEQFAYVASHDLQEPLRMVNSYTQLLLRRFGPALNDPDAAEFASYITSGVQHMQLLIHDLLTYSKVIHSDALEPGSEVDLNACLRQVLAMLQETISEPGAAVIAEPLPVVNGDASQFEQVLQNLISNALKYRSAGVPPEVRISAARTGNEWVVAVRDNGIGFDMQYAERIFGLFKRLHKADYPGTGIGLAICKRIVERCRGRMWAVSEPGQGSTFYFSLPA
jgi:light-regulated signal transduction histidine kinase (bacteriophytochrome)